MNDKKLLKIIKSMIGPLIIMVILIVVPGSKAIDVYIEGGYNSEIIIILLCLFSLIAFMCFMLLFVLIAILYNINLIKENMFCIKNNSQSNDLVKLQDNSSKNIIEINTNDSETKNVKSPTITSNTNTSNSTAKNSTVNYKTIEQIKKESIIKTANVGWICKKCKAENNSRSLFCKDCGTYK